MSPARLRDITLKDFEGLDAEARASLIRGDAFTLNAWQRVAHEVINIMVARKAMARNASGADLVQRLINALAHTAFLGDWIRTTLPPHADARKVKFGAHFDCLHHSDGRKKPRSSWVDLGISLLIETERPWGSDLSPDESQERFRAALWRGEVLPRIMKRLDDCPGWLRLDLNQQGGEIEKWLWRLHWAPEPEGGSYTGRPSLGPYLANLVFCRDLSRGLNKGTRIVDPLIFGFSAPPADAWDFDSDAEEAGWYRWLLLGETDVSSKIVLPRRQHRRFPLPGRLRSLLERNAYLLGAVGLGDVLEQAVGRLGTVIRREYARAYHIDGKDAASITNEITRKRCRCQERVNRKRQRCTCPSKTNRILNDLWKEFGSNEINRNGKDGLDDALAIIEMAGRGGSAPTPPTGGGEPNGSSGGGSDASKDGSQGAETGAGNGQDGGFMRIDERILSAIQGITNLQTGEWLREEIPDDTYAHWIEVLGRDMVGAILDIDRDEFDELGDLAAVLRFIRSETCLNAADLRNWVRRNDISLLPAVGGGPDIAIGETIPIPATWIGAPTHWPLPRPDAVSLICFTDPDLVAEGGPVRLDRGRIDAIPDPRLDRWHLFAVAFPGGAPLVFALRRADPPHPAENPVRPMDRVESTRPPDPMVLLNQGRLWECWAAATTPEGTTPARRDAWALMILSQAVPLIDEAVSDLAAESDSSPGAGGMGRALRDLDAWPMELDGIKQSIIEKHAT